jgi:uncharacterized small protein (DUF1192 family)
MRIRETLAAIAAAALLAWPLARLSGAVARGMAADRPYEFVHVPQGRTLALLSPGIRLSIANAYWLSAVQYLGDRGGKERGWGNLFPVVDLVTDLDPRHGYAYQTAGIFLSSVQEVEASDRILEKGFRSGPRWWSYPYYLAFNAVFYRQDYDAAARWAEEAAKTPGAPSVAVDMALTMAVKSSGPDAAVRMLEHLRGEMKDEKSAGALEAQWRLAVLQRDFARLDAAVARFRAERGAAPASLDEVVRAGLLDRVPREPNGGRYYLDPKDGKVHSSAHDFRITPPARRGELLYPREHP